MQLLTYDFLSILLTALVVSGLLAGLATAAVWALRPTGTSIGVTFLAILTFSLLGFVTGKVMGNSREAAVGTVIPAVLTLLGGVSIYVIGVKGVRAQMAVSAMVLCFALALFVGSHFGAQLRYDYELFVNDPGLVGDRDLHVEKRRHQLDLQRLLHYVELMKFQKALQEKEGVDLSKFHTTLGEVPDGKPDKPSPSNK